MEMQQIFNAGQRAYNHAYSIALVVSTVMIGVITSNSVIERTREIGILRSLGLSNGDIAIIRAVQYVFCKLGSIAKRIGHIRRPRPLLVGKYISDWNTKYKGNIGYFDVSEMFIYNLTMIIDLVSLMLVAVASIALVVRYLQF